MSAIASTTPAGAGGELQHRAFTSGPASSFNEQARTIEIVWGEGARVKRYSYEDGAYWEELAMDGSSVRMGRFETGMSLTDSHDAYSIDSRIGTVVAGTAKIVGGRGTAVVKLSRNARGESIFQDLRDNHPFQVSIGYRVFGYEKREADGDNLAVLRAIDWEVYEVSVVIVPADAGAHSRSQERRVAMSTTTTATTTAPPAPATIDLDAERRRSIEILGLARSAGIESEGHAAITSGMTVANFRERAFSAMVERQESSSTFPHVSLDAHNARASSDGVVSALTDVLMGRGNRSGLDVARDYLAATGQRAGSDRDISRQLFGGSSRSINGLHATSDFAILTATAAQATLLERFHASPSVLRAISRKQNARDFRPQGAFRLGEVPALLRVGEHGEIKSGTISEEKNAFAIDTYARIFGLTMQAQVNDTLGAFANFLANFAESAINLEADLFYNLFSENNFEGPVLQDGVRLFHVNHGNLAATASALSIDSIGQGVLAMRSQRNVSGNAPAATAPAFLIVGPASETKARQLLAAISATRAADTNPFSDLRLIVEDRFGPIFQGWYLASDPARRAALVHGSLDGSDVPDVQTRDGWKVLGTEYRVVHHFGCGINDFRAIFYNPGVPA